MMKAEFQEIMNNWKLPDGGTLLERIEKMIRPALWAGYFGSSAARFVCGLQYHLGGEKDTEDLARLASLTSNDHVLDVCCFVGGSAIQLADSFRCKVTGIDISEACIVAANRIAELSGLSHLAYFRMADAGNLPFEDGRFTVVWNQASLEHYGVWLREFDRVLVPGGRLALTFEIGTNHPEEDSRGWRLQDVAHFVERLGYSIEHAEDITQRDIEIGWKPLDKRLSEQEEEFSRVLGEDWVQNAHKEFANEIERMRKGEWGNGRIVAQKNRACSTTNT